MSLARRVMQRIAKGLAIVGLAALCLVPNPIQAHAQTIVAFGASNTAGYGVGKSAAWPARLEALLRARGVPATVINAGISGNTSRDLLARLDASVPAGTRVLILDSHGFNDMRKGQMGEFKGNIARISARMAARRISVVRIPREFLSKENRLPDGIHLNATGHARLAAAILPRVLAAVRK